MVMLLNSIFLVLIANSAFGDLVRDSDRIHFGRPEINRENGKYRNDYQRLRPFKTQETFITFIDEIDSKDTNKWSNRPNYSGSTNVNEPSSNKRSQHGGGSQLIENGDNNRVWESTWRPFSTNLNSNRKMQGSDKENVLWGSPGGSRSPFLSGGVSNEKVSENKSKRKLLPEDSCGIDLPRRILGGITADIDEYPWLALMQYRDRNGKISHDCGGTLISSRYVITAAHCTIGLGVTTKNLKLEKVRLGEWDLSKERDCQQQTCSDPLQDIEVEEIINHPDYNPRQTSQTHDIALIRLRRKAKINEFVEPICLPLDDVGGRNYEGKTLTVAGWGRTSNAKNSDSDFKMKVDIPVVSWDTCRDFYESYYSDVKISKTQMCAGGEQGRDSCQGDSGGPLMSSEVLRNDIRWFLIGIVSSGPAACGVEGRPSLYTKVSEYTDWILDSMRE